MPAARPIPPAKPANLPTAKAPAPPPSRPEPAPTPSPLSGTVPVVSAPEESDPERKKRIKKELKKLARKEERAEEKYEILTEECEKGALAATILSWGMRAYAFGLLLVVAGAGAATFSPPGSSAAFLILGIIAGGIAGLVIMGGFGVAIVGPEAGRHLAIMGLIVCFLHGGITVVQFAKGYSTVRKMVEEENRDRYSWVDLGRVLDLYGPVTDLTLLAEQPARVLKEYPLSWFGIGGASMEFTRLVLICLLAQNYAAAGRARELGHSSMEAVSRIFWVILLSAMFRVSFAFMFDHASPEELWAKIGLGAHGALTLFSMLGIGYFVFQESQILLDTAEVVDPRRYSLEAETYEV